MRILPGFYLSLHAVNAVMFLVSFSDWCPSSTPSWRPRQESSLYQHAGAMSFMTGKTSGCFVSWLWEADIFWVPLVSPISRHFLTFVSDTMSQELGEGPWTKLGSLWVHWAHWRLEHDFQSSGKLEKGLTLSKFALGVCWQQHGNNQIKFVLFKPEKLVMHWLSKSGLITSQLIANTYAFAYF